MTEVRTVDSEVDIGRAIEQRVGPSIAEHRPVTKLDLPFTGPGTVAGNYLRRYWHPVLVANELAPGTAKPLRVMGEAYTLYRGMSGSPYIIDARCAHRRTLLSLGTVEDDCLRCMYHGWKYDSTGQCIEQPAEGPENFAAKVKIESFPCREYLGLIFGYFGPGEAPPFPRIPDFEQEGVLENRSNLRKYNYYNFIDNDPVHVYWVHRGTYLEVKEIPRLPRYEETSYGTSHDIEGDGVTRAVHRLMPTGMILDLPPRNPGDTWWSMVSWVTPHDDESHTAFAAQLHYVTGEDAELFRERRAARPKWDGPPVWELAARIVRGEMTIDEVNHREMKVLVQDDAVMLAQQPIVDRSKERLGRSDVTLTLIRKVMLREIRALEEGRPLKEWLVPPGLTGPHPDRPIRDESGSSEASDQPVD